MYTRYQNIYLLLKITQYVINHISSLTVACTISNKVKKKKN